MSSEKERWKFEVCNNNNNNVIGSVTTLYNRTNRRKSDGSHQQILRRISRIYNRETCDLRLSGNLGAHRDLRSLYLLVRLVSVHDMYAKFSLSKGGTSPVQITSSSSPIQVSPYLPR